MTQQQQLCLRVCSDFDYKQLEFFVLRQMRENFRNDQRRPSVQILRFHDCISTVKAFVCKVTKTYNMDSHPIHRLLEKHNWTAAGFRHWDK